MCQISHRRINIPEIILSVHLFLSSIINMLISFLNTKLG